VEPVQELGNGDGTSTPPEYAHNRIFYLNIPICALCFVGVAQFLTLRKTNNSFSQKVRRIDWIGVLVFMASTTSLLFGITVGGTIYEWTSFRALVPIILGAVGLLAFGIIEAFLSKDPMMPLRVFASRTALSAYLGIFLHGLVYYISNFAEYSRQCGTSPSTWSSGFSQFAYALLLEPQLIHCLSLFPRL
jgi:hypothetical protein